MIYSFGHYQIDTARFELSCKGVPVAVQPQVFELLTMLIENRDQVISKDELLNSIWKGRVVSETTLSSRIKTARQVIGDDGSRQEFIKTIHGRGFRFVGKVKVHEDPASSAVTTKPSIVNRPATSYARSGDTHIAYHLFGDGPVNLVLTPGFVSHIDNYWDDPHLAGWLARLGDLARVAIFDKRGTGMSDRVIELPSMDERMDDVRAVFDEVGFDTAYIMGVSEGGSLATLFAAHQPERCDGLLLYGSFAQFEHWYADEASLQELFDYIESDWGSGNSLPQFAPSMANDRFYMNWWGKFERLGATPGAAIALMKMNSQIDISGVLPSIRVPTLVIHRAGDVLIDVEGGRYIAEHIDGAQYLEIVGNDHLPWVGENTVEIIDAIASFLDGTEKPEHTNCALATIVQINTDAEGVDAIAGVFGSFRSKRVEVRPEGIAAIFDGPARALACAASVSRLLHNEHVPHRVGVHIGEIDLAMPTLLGTALEIASDVANHADNGEILVSRTVSDLVAGSGITLEDKGIFHLATIKQDWSLYCVVFGKQHASSAAQKLQQD
jgi:pimeloyl-ACP methyl ester carboxylesterase